MSWWNRRSALEQPHEHELVAPAPTSPAAPAPAEPWRQELALALSLLDELSGHLRLVERDKAAASVSDLVNRVLDVRYRVQRALNVGRRT